MRLPMILFVCVCLFPINIFCQERIIQFMTGPKDNKIRIVAAFIEPSAETLKTQSMIIDLDPIKNNQEVSGSVFVDLTSTVRSLITGDKKQKILQLRWNKKGEIEMRCNDKWSKQDAIPATTKIIETTKSLIQIIPLSKETTEFTPTPEIQQSILTVLESLKPETFSCLRQPT
jgi:hypothetical protein